MSLVKISQVNPTLLVSGTVPIFLLNEYPNLNLLHIKWIPRYKDPNKMHGATFLDFTWTF